MAGCKASPLALFNRRDIDRHYHRVVESYWGNSSADHYWSAHFHRVPAATADKVAATLPVLRVVMVPILGSANSDVQLGIATRSGFCCECCRCGISADPCNVIAQCCRYRDSLSSAKTDQVVRPPRDECKREIQYRHNIQNDYDR
jgi:hypothetical protein